VKDLIERTRQALLEKTEGFGDEESLSWHPLRIRMALEMWRVEVEEGGWRPVRRPARDVDEQRREVQVQAAADILAGEMDTWEAGQDPHEGDRGRERLAAALGWMLGELVKEGLVRQVEAPESYIEAAEWALAKGGDAGWKVVESLALDLAAWGAEGVRRVPTRVTLDATDWLNEMEPAFWQACANLASPASGEVPVSTPEETFAVVSALWRRCLSIRKVELVRDPEHETEEAFARRAVFTMWEMGETLLSLADAAWDAEAVKDAARRFLLTRNSVGCSLEGGLGGMKRGEGEREGKMGRKGEEGKEPT